MQEQCDRAKEETNDVLAQARAAIDDIDDAMRQLFCRRMEQVRHVGAWKQANGLPVLDSGREAEILARQCAAVPDATLAPGYGALLQCEMALSRAYQALWEIQAAERTVAGAQMVPLPVPGGVCPIYVGDGLLARADTWLGAFHRVLILTDDGVPGAYVAQVQQACRRATVLCLPQGEGSKSMASLQEVLSAMAEAQLDREDALVSLGGGMVGDLGGLAAALYMRGIAHYLIPTTLLAQVDASVGGKCAVNMQGAKNLAGLFSFPRAVLIDPLLLQSLPPRQMASGMAEIIKMAVTLDAGLFARLEQQPPFSNLEETVLHAIRLKAAVVSRDAHEAGERRVLNYGHTWGHALESAAQGALLHGEAVALGMLPFAAPAVRGRLLALYRRVGLPCTAHPDLARAREALLHDKKRQGETCLCVTVPEVGRYTIQPFAWDALAALWEEKQNG